MNKILCLMNAVIYSSINYRCLEECHKPVWSRYVGRLLEVCLQVAAIVSPVVQNSSPEGNVPEEAVLGTAVLCVYVAGHACGCSCAHVHVCVCVFLCCNGCMWLFLCVCVCVVMQACGCSCVCVCVSVL